MDIRTIQADDAMLMKLVRLASVSDAPYAFGLHTFDEESVLPDLYWEELVAQLAGDRRCVGYVAMDGIEPCGTAIGCLCSVVPGRAYFTAAWVAGSYRRRGIGSQLMELCKCWAAAHGANHLVLWVDDINPEAVKFYKAIGFEPTGENRPVALGAVARQSSYQLALTASR